MIPISREAISKWERGKNGPDKQSIIRLCEIFEITVDELLYGERKNKYNSTSINEIKVNLYEDRNQAKKKLKILLFFTILLLIFFLIYYFITTYNSLKVYTVNYYSDNINIDGGLIVKTKEKLYFNLGNIQSIDEISNMELYYITKNNERKTICESNDNKIEFEDYKGYDQYINFDDIDNILKNLYIEITSNENMQSLKLNINKNFSNDYIVPKNFESINNNSKLAIDKVKFEEYVKNNFKFQDDSYYKKIKNYDLYYFLDNKTLNVISQKGSTIKEWYFDIEKNYFEYQEYQYDVSLNNFIYNNGKIECNISNCENANDAVLELSDLLNQLYT